MKEIWKDIPDYEGLYQVSDMGKVRSIAKDIVISARPNNKGYLRVNLSKNSKVTKVLVHVLVAIVFLGHVPDGMNVVVDHKDGNKLNNHKDNLQIITQRKNCTKEAKGSSKYVGVRWRESRKKWVASITIDAKKISLGHFDNEEDAAKAYQEKLKTL